MVIFVNENVFRIVKFVRLKLKRLYYCVDMLKMFYVLLMKINGFVKYYVILFFYVFIFVKEFVEIVGCKIFMCSV